MDFIVFVPGILCMIAVVRKGTRWAFLNVVLPVLALLPFNFYLRLRHVPPLNFLDLTLCALGIGMILNGLRGWRWSRTDLWLALFLLSSSYSERLPWGINGALLHLIVVVFECLVPYTAAKLLMGSPQMRLETVKRLVGWLVVASVLSIPQFFLKWDLYTHLWSHVFSGQFPDIPQVRGGFGRVQGPYGVAESAGMVLMIGLLFGCWLRRADLRDPSTRTGFDFLLRHWRTVVFVLACTLFMTQSRGPWIGAIVGLCVSWIGLGRRPIRTAILVFGLGLAIALPLYVAAKRYVGEQKSTDYGSERQTAQYRSELIDNYIPIAERGGFWGWGNTFPQKDGQFSIDNEYLFVWLIQGYVGLLSFILLFVEASVSLFRLGIWTRSPRERYLVFSILGILVGLSSCLATVWLNAQADVLFFLIIGWSQAVPPVRRRQIGREEARFAVQVYT